MVRSRCIIFATVMAGLLGLAAVSGALAAEQESPANGAKAAESAPDASQTGVNDPRRKSPPVVFKKVDYEDTGPETGKMTLSGRGDPGAQILLFFDDEPFGQATIAEDGTWSFEAEKKLDSGQHNFRADRIDAATGVVVGRASVNIARVEE